MERPELCFKVWEGLLLQQRKARFIALARGQKADAEGTVLNYAEALILLILDAETERNVRELSAALKLERSWVSRILTALEEKGFVESRNPETDRRSRSVSLSRKGRAELRRLLEARADVVEETFKALNEDEQKELKILLHKLADGLGAPQYSSWTQAHFLDAELARISWMVGVIGENFMHSGLNATRYQLLYELAKASDKFSSASDMALAFPADMSTVSRTLVAFCEEGLAERKPSPQDARKQLVKINKRGQALWNKVRDTAAEVMSAALKDLPLADLKLFTDLMGRVNAEIPSRMKNVLSERKSEVRSIDRHEKESLFAHSAAWLSSLKALPNPESLEAYGFFEKGSIRAMLQLERQNGLIKKLYLSSDELKPREVMNFMKNSLRLAARL